MANEAKVTMRVADPTRPQLTKPPRLTKHTEEIKVTRFPVLVPYGVTVLREWGRRWTIRCGKFCLNGHDGDHDSIVKLFLTFVKDSIDCAKKEAENEMPQRTNS